MPWGKNLIWWMLLAVFLSGCGTKYPRLNIVEPLPEEIRCRIVLLPFVYEGKVPRGENIFYKAFTTELKNVGGFEVVQEAELLKLYQQFRLYRSNQPNEFQLQAIGNRLDAQLIVLGDIIEMTEVDTGSYVETNITVSVRIFEAATGNVLWSTYHKRKGEEYRNVMHYGRVNTITGLSRIMSNEIISLWIDEGVNTCVAH